MNLHTNLIGDKGVAAIGEALKVNGSLTSLDVRDNKIGAVGAKALGEGLKLNGSLKEVRSERAHALPSRLSGCAVSRAAEPRAQRYRR